MASEVHQRILEILSREAGVEPERLKPDAALADLGVSSVDIISVSFAIEDAFGVVLEPESFGDVKTVGQLLEAIEARVSPS